MSWWCIRYGAAVVAPIVGLLLRLAIVHWVGDLPTYITFYPVVMIVALLAGIGPGLAATVMAALLTAVWIIAPRGHLGLESTADVVGQCLFLSMGALMSAVAGLYRRARERAAVLERQLALRQSEEELRRQKDLLAVTLASIGDAVLVTDTQGRVTFINAEAERLTGWTNPEAVGQPVTAVFHIISQETREPAENPVDKVLRSGSIVGLANHTVLVARDGHETPIDDSGAPIRGGGGDALGVVLVFRDVTEQNAAHQFKSRLAAIVESSDNTILSKDLAGAIQTWNRAAERMFGYTADEVIGRPVTLLYPPELVHEEAGIIRRLRLGERIENFESVRVAKDGRRIDVQVNISPVHDSDGCLVAASTIIRDITERKRAENALRDSQADLNRAQAVAQTGSWRLDVRRNELLWSDENHRLFGIPKGTPLTYETFLSTVHPDDREFVDDRWKRALRGEHYDIEHRIVVDGQVRWLREKAELESDEQGKLLGGFGTSQDITELKRATEELAAAKISAEQAKAAAEEANKAKDHFLAVLSHELRTPLMPVLATVSLLQAQASLDPEIHQQLEVVRRNVELEARLIDDLLDVTRIARGKVELDRRPVQLGEVLNRAVEVCRPDIEARQLDFSLDIDLQTSCVIDADPGRLQQVFWNLIKNAVKFTPHGGRVSVRCCLEDPRESSAFGVQVPAINGGPLSLNPEPVSGDRTGSPNKAKGLLDPPFVVVEVCDNGEGIEPDALPRIFNAFEQAERSITRQFGGLGLGLTISKALVEMHSGTIHAESKGRGQGATFRVRLPLLKPTPPPRGPTQAPPEKAASSLPTSSAHELATVGPAAPTRPLRVLLVEDHGDTSRIMTRLLTLKGYEVHSAADVNTGLAVAGAQLAAEKPFDLLISDLGLPDRSGLELIRELRSRGHTMPAIAISGYGQDEDIQRSRQAGFNAHLTKPVDFEQFYRAIAAALR